MTSVQSNILILNTIDEKFTVALCAVDAKGQFLRVGTICTYPKRRILKNHTTI